MLLFDGYIEIILLSALAMMTSAIAAVLGFGGGMLLIAALPVFLPAALVIPIHSVTQLFSNVSRMALSIKGVEWALLPKFLLGSLIGLGLSTLLLVNVSMAYIPARHWRIYFTQCVESIVQSHDQPL